MATLQMLQQKFSEPMASALWINGLTTIYFSASDATTSTITTVPEPRGMRKLPHQAPIKLVAEFSSKGGRYQTPPMRNLTKAAHTRSLTLWTIPPDRRMMPLSLTTSTTLINSRVHWVSRGKHQRTSHSNTQQYTSVFYGTYNPDQSLLALKSAISTSEPSRNGTNAAHTYSKTYRNYMVNCYTQPRSCLQAELT